MSVDDLLMEVHHSNMIDGLFLFFSIFIYCSLLMAFQKDAISFALFMKINFAVNHSLSKHRMGSKFLTCKAPFQYPCIEITQRIIAIGWCKVGIVFAGYGIEYQH